ncbi:MAG: LPXTG cell wall anchor domain-containing protein [Lentisphaerae bacterium]|nr:LPXTG cell wall anchor domain-containing protein [Lentisphaerota bacterium]
MSAGIPPTGLNVSNHPRIAGTPTTDGTFTFTLRMTDPFGQFDEKEFEIYIEPAGEYTFVETIEVLNVTATTATVKGEVYEHYGPSTIRRGFLWSTDDHFDYLNGIFDDEFYELMTPAEAEGEFTHEITGLSPGTTYYVCAFISYEGVAYGRILEFTTLQTGGGSDNGGEDPDADPDPDPDPDPGDKLDDVPDTGDGGGFPAVIGLISSGVLGGGALILSRKKKRM